MNLHLGVNIAVLKIKSIQKTEETKTMHFWKRQKLEKIKTVRKNNRILPFDGKTSWLGYLVTM